MQAYAEATTATQTTPEKAVATHLGTTKMQLNPPTHDTKTPMANIKPADNQDQLRSAQPTNKRCILTFHPVFLSVNVTPNNC